MKFRQIKLLISLIFSATADFNSALDNYTTQQYKSAYEEFLAMAQLGEKRSQFNLGVMYHNGEHVKKDINKAYAWLKLAIDSETSSSKEKETFELVKGKIKDKNAAEKEYLELKKLYSTSVLLRKLYPEFIKPVNDAAFEANPVKIAEPKYPRRAAMKGISGWVRYEFDIDKAGVPRNIALIESFPEQTFVKESVKAIRKWRFEPKKSKDGTPLKSSGVMYTMEFKIKNSEYQIKQEKLKQITQSAKDGDSNSQFTLAYLQTKFSSLRKDSNPNQLFIAAAQQGHPAAQYHLGTNLVKGQGCIQDKVKGVEWLTRSATTGHKDAKEMLAIIASKTETLQSHQNALNLIKDIEKLNPRTQMHIAWMLIKSPFTEVNNPKKAIQLADELPEDLFWDNATEYEIKAAAYAALENYDEAINMQKKALSKAKRMDVDMTEIKEHLSLLKQNKKWF